MASFVSLWNISSHVRVFPNMKWSFLRNPSLMFYSNNFSFFFIERGFDERIGGLCLCFCLFFGKIMKFCFLWAIECLVFRYGIFLLCTNFSTDWLESDMQGWSFFKVLSRHFALHSLLVSQCLPALFFCVNFLSLMLSLTHTFILVNWLILIFCFRLF